MTKRKAVPSRKKTQDSADSTLPLLREPRLLVITSNFLLGQLFARGILLPSGLDQPEFDRSGEAGRLLVVNSRVPFDVARRVEMQARNSYPIALEVTQVRNGRWTSEAGVASEFECICLSDVQEILFRTQSEKERFVDLEYSNYAVPPINLTIAPDAFEAVPAEAVLAEKISPASTLTTPSSSVEPNGDFLGALRRVDCALGLVAWGLQAIPGRESWVDGLARAVAGKKANAKTSWIERLLECILDSSVRATSVDEALLVAATTTMLEHPLESGWAPERILADIAARARAIRGNDRSIAEIAKWEDRAREVLQSKAEPSSLSDEAFRIQRGILLQLLRGELGTDEATRPNGIDERTGIEVDALADAFAAIRTGLRALPVRYKRDPEGDRFNRLALLGERFYDMLRTRQVGGRLVKGAQSLKVEYRPSHPLRGHWAFSLGDKPIASISRSVEPAIERLYTMGRHLGIKFEESGDVSLRCERPTHAGGLRPVFVEVVPKRPANRSMVRFMSPVMTIAGVGGRGKLSKELAIDLLRQNSARNINCRFAIDDDGATIVVLVDQLFATLDDDEFIHHIEHVVEVAEGFRLSGTVGEVH